MNHSDRQMQEIALMVHTLLTAGHCLGIVYNVKRRNWLDVAAHTAAAAYDVSAINKHMRTLHAEPEFVS